MPSDKDKAFAYPWEGGDYKTSVRVFAPDEPDEEGETREVFMIGLGDYCDEGEPDLILRFTPGEKREHVEWVASALHAAMWATDSEVSDAE